MFSYQKLKSLRGREEDVEELVVDRRRWGWRRPKVLVAVLLRRVVKGKAATIRVTVGKMIKRLNEGRPYVSELFAGNYMFMQVNPSGSMPYLNKSLLPSSRLLQNDHHPYAVTPRKFVLS